jgi:hypothetical protein
MEKMIDRMDKKEAVKVLPYLSFAGSGRLKEKILHSQKRKASRDYLKKPTTK